MCDFQCIYERGGLCLLDNDACTNTCDRNNNCDICENDCKKENENASKN